MRGNTPTRCRSNLHVTQIYSRCSLLLRRSGPRNSDEFECFEVRQILYCFWEQVTLLNREGFQDPVILHVDTGVADCRLGCLIVDI
jgi:hypothetical protein